MKNIVLALGFAAMVVSVGCGGNKIDQVFDKQEAIGRKSCDCIETLSMGMTTMAQCLADLEADLPSETQRQCLRDVYDRNSGTLDASADCLLDASNDLESCINSASCNAAALQTCVNTFNAVAETCPTPPETVQAEINACGG